MKKLLFASAICGFSCFTSAQDLHFGFEDWKESLSFVPALNETAIDGVSQCHPHLNGTASMIGFSGGLGANDILPDWSAEIFGIMRSTDAHSGTYAGIVNMWYNGATGKLAYGNMPVFETATSYPKIHFSGRLYGISGYYKYYVDSFIENDTYRKAALLHIVTYKRNETSGLPEEMSHDSLIFKKSDVYTEFYLPVSLPETSALPDSLSIWFESKGYHSGTTSCTYSHFLYLDDVVFRFAPYTLSVSNILSPAPFSIAPNPSQNHLEIIHNSNLRIQKIHVSDASGRHLQTLEGDIHTMDVSNWNSGLYFLQIQTGNGNFHEKLMKQ